jgi:hypothetical protein
LFLQQPTQFLLQGGRAVFSALQVIFLFEKQENVLIRALICGLKDTFGLWVKFPHP